MHQWVVDVQSLTKMTVKQPQTAFSALTRSLHCEWQFLQCVIPDCGSLFAPLDEVLTSVFFQLSLVQT